MLTAKSSSFPFKPTFSRRRNALWPDKIVPSRSSKDSRSDLSSTAQKNDEDIDDHYLECLISPGTGERLSISSHALDEKTPNGIVRNSRCCRQPKHERSPRMPASCFFLNFLSRTSHPIRPCPYPIRLLTNTLIFFT